MCSATADYASKGWAFEPKARVRSIGNHVVSKSNAIAGGLIVPQTGYRVEIDGQETHGSLCTRFLDGEMMPCFLGLSPETSFSNRNRLTTILAWLAPRASSIVILEGTYFSRWDAIVFEHMPPSLAAQRALHRVRLFEQRASRTIHTLDIASKVRLLSWPDILDEPRVAQVRQGLREYAAGVRAFAMALEDVLDEYLARARAGVGPSLTPEERDTLRNYIYEELSVFLHLCEGGYPLEVYPGSDLGIMQEIAAGTYPSFPVACPNRSHISIRLVDG